MALNEAQIRDILGAIALPRGGVLGETGATPAISIRGGRVICTVEIDAADATLIEEARAHAERKLAALPGVESAVVGLTAARIPMSAEQSRAPVAASSDGLAGVRHIIAVGSGKGGVGKSTTSCNLAVALVAQGLRVGILDADIYGPSQPRLFGSEGKPDFLPSGMIAPIDAFGVRMMSIGFLVDDSQPVIWRGPMISSVIGKMLREVAWGELDILLIDLPPGTGDVQLTIGQKAPLDGAIIVSTPQDLALIDARRAIAMFEKLAVPVLGLIENMSSFCCPNCGHDTAIFGTRGARDEAERLGLPFLGEIPLHSDIRALSDEGRPIAISNAGGRHAAAYGTIASAIGAMLNAPAQKVRLPRISMPRRKG